MGKASILFPNNSVVRGLSTETREGLVVSTKNDVSTDEKRAVPFEKDT